MKTNKMCAIMGNEHEYNDLLPLTENRPLSALYFDCKYRLMDFALSNVVNANIRRVYVILNEGKVKSLLDHLGGGREWGLDSVGSYQYLSFFGDIVQKKLNGKPYYCDVIDFLKKSMSDYTVFIGNKMLCNIDLKAVLRSHQAQNATLTTVFKRVPQTKIAKNDNVLTLDNENRVLNTAKFGNTALNNDLYNLNLNIFMAKTSWLIEALERGEENGAPASIEDFLLSQLGVVETYAYEYTGYLSNIYDIKSYYDANMDMLDPEKFASLLFSSQKIITRTKNEVATYFSEEAQVKSSHLATGCVINGSVQDSLISRMTLVDQGAKVDHALVMSNGVIKKGAVIRHAILDKDVTVDAGVKVIGTPNHPYIVAKGTHVTSDLIGGELK